MPRAVRSRFLIGIACVMSAGACSKRLAVPAPAPLDAGAAWTNSLGMRFVPVPGTRVLFAVHETRMAEFRLFLDETQTEWIPPDAERSPDHPAANVTWDDAVAFCEWLTQRERVARVLVAPARYRLPTDAEWSLAAGLDVEAGGWPAEKSHVTTFRYAWGNAWPPPEGAGNFWGEEAQVDRRERDSFIAGYRDPFRRLAPVGQFGPNQNGLFDVAGNVLEWCDDWYDASHRGHVARGGSWMNGDARSLALTHRAEIAPRAGLNVVGFRCVVVP